MKKVVRAKHITILQVKLVDIGREKIFESQIILPSWYTSDKIMLTKLSELLEQENKRLIELISCEKYVRYFEQSLTYFEHHAEKVYDKIYSTRKKERTSTNNEERK